MTVDTTTDAVARDRLGALTARARDELVRFLPLLIIAVLLVALSLRNPDLLTVDSLLTMADSAAPLLVLAAGATVVILCGGIDLSIGALASFASVLLALWTPALSGWAAVPVIAVTAVAGVLQGWVHVAARVPSFIVTLGGLSLWTGLALALSGAKTVPITDLSAFAWAFTRVRGLPSAILVALALVAVISAVMRLTPFGRWVCSIGHAESAARLAGLPVDRVKIAAFGISGAAAGLAGLLLVARTFSGAPTLGDSLLLPAVAAVVVGGTAITGGHGGLGKTVMGAFVVVLLRVGLSLIGVDAGVEPILYGALIVIAVSVTIDRSKVAVMK
ncbi:MAG TPA: ABC transporter permease [Egibacteraceae bacterium]